MASMKRVRKSFREEALRLVNAGEGNFEKLIELAGQHFGRDVGYETLIKSFLGSEVNNSMAVLRTDGYVESVGKKWVPAATLSPDQQEVVSIRRWKRLRGELKSEEQFAHEHGMTDRAAQAGELLSQVSNWLQPEEVAAESVIPPVA